MHAFCRTLSNGTGQEQPDFLPMFPWYSGTSADMYRTMIDLVISVKLFLGRFDMRTMEVGCLASWPGLHAALVCPGLVKVLEPQYQTCGPWRWAAWPLGLACMPTSCTSVRHACHAPGGLHAAPV